MNDLLKRAQDAVSRGIQWLIGHQQPDGSLADCGSELLAIYKAPLALAGAGRTEAGVRCLEYIKAHNVDRDWQLVSGDGTHKTAFPRNEKNFANYMDGWVAIGAWMLGDFEFADRLCGRLVKQMADHGGVLTGPQAWCGAPRYDVLTSASAGRAFLHVGLRDKAARVADFLCEVVESHQRDLEWALDMSFDAAWKRLEADDKSNRLYYELDHRQRGQRVFCPAFACSFLCEIAPLSDRGKSPSAARYLKAAKKYLEVITWTPEFRDQSLPNGKSGWAAGMLAVANHDALAREAALQIMPKMLARQRDDGEFSSPGDTDQTPLAKRLESTAEHVAWATQYERLLTVGF